MNWMVQLRIFGKDIEPGSVAFTGPVYPEIDDLTAGSK
jgi:hypothetical protein